MKCRQTLQRQLYTDLTLSLISMDEEDLCQVVKDKLGFLGRRGKWKSIFSAKYKRSQ